MKEAWHIARKDLRRYAGPAGVWLVFVVAAAVWFWTAATVMPSYPLSQFSRTDVVFGVVRAVQLIIAALLVGAMVLEDPLVGSEVFWRSRPIRRTSLLAAKAMSAGLLFVVGPALVLVPVWLGIGFGWSGTALAAVELAREQAGVALLALMFAALSRGLGEFIFVGLAVMLVQGGFAIAAVWWWANELAPRIVATRSGLVETLSTVGMMGVIGHQFLTLRRRRSWLLLAIVIVVPFAVGFGWPRTDRAGGESAMTVETRGATSRLAERAKRIARGEEKPTASAWLAGELPVLDGAKIAAGANRVSVFDIVRRPDGDPTTVLVEERDAWLALREGRTNRGQDALARAKSRQDVWVLRTRAPETWQVLHAEEMGAAVFASMIVGVRRLTLPFNITAAEMEGAVLIKVRFDAAEAR